MHKLQKLPFCIIYLLKLVIFLLLLNNITKQLTLTVQAHLNLPEKINSAYNPPALRGDHVRFTKVHVPTPG